ncbi:MAG: ribosome biogenesis factor YjgA [Pseudohongiellaceae bacterium]
MDEFDPEQPPSKTKRKKDMTGLQNLGRELTGYTKSRLDHLNLPAPLRAAIDEYKRLPNSHEAKRRQLQFIGRIMRDVDVESIHRSIADLHSPPPEDRRRLQRLQQSTDAVLTENQELINQLLKEYPELERQQLRQFFRQHEKAALDAKPAVRSKLTAYLRRVL